MEKNNELAQKNQNDNFKKRLVPGFVLVVLAVTLSVIPVFYFNLALIGILIFFLIGAGREIKKNTKRINTKKKNIVQKVFSIHFCLSLTILALLGFGILGGNGQYWFLATVFIAGVACDMVAYSAGNLWKKFGKTHKLAPVISPGKTVEGAIVSFVTTIISTWFLGTQFLSLDCYVAIGSGFVIALSATLGDLFESYYKRTMEIKDSGDFFRGHGGFLDRIDSYLGVAYAVAGIRILVSLI